MHGRRGCLALTALIFLASGAAAVTSLDDIVMHARYRMLLTTGDELEGTVEGTTDTSLILEADDGTPYTFRSTIIREYELLELPRRLSSPARRGRGLHEAEILSIEELEARMPFSDTIEITITSGPSFHGTVVSVDDKTLRLNVKGSIIPFSTDIIKQISTVPPAPEDPGARETRKKPMPKDTVYVLNPEVDEFGRRGEPVKMVGPIVREESEAIFLRTDDGVERRIDRSQIVRIYKNTASSIEGEILRYGRGLTCPPDMVLIDLPPGTIGRPFFKVCMDLYEYPNKEGALPVKNISFEEARKQCREKGKRLCTAQEWQWACSGLDGQKFPYGNQYESKKCNIDGFKHLAPSGGYSKCVSPFGLYDMVGNIFEWVTGDGDKPMLMGGPLSRCHNISPGMEGHAKPNNGFRCCKSN